MQQYTDQIGNTILLRSTPKRIVSLVPSQTELLYDLDLENEVVGITKFCIHPNRWFKTKMRVGGTKNVNFNNIASLKPDLIIANKEENTKSEIEQLIKLYPTWVSDISNLDEVCKMISEIGKITKTHEKALKIAKNIKKSLKNISKDEKKSVLYLIWNNPYMSINQHTFIHHMIELNGWTNVIANNIERYPIISNYEIEKMNPDFILLSSEPFPFKEKNCSEIQDLFPNSKVLLVDGEMFSWYGSRLLKASEYFNKLHQIINLQ